MHPRLGAACASLFVACAVAACGGEGGDGGERTATTTAPTVAPASPVPVVVDTDLASDDLVALAFLLMSADVDLRAVTVSGTGEVRCPQGLRVIRGLLVATGDPDVPVACGRSSPLAGEHAFPTEWRDAADDTYGLDLPAGTPPDTERTAVDVLTEALAPRGVTLLTLGPLTNVAAVFRADPGLARQLSSIVVMGGALDVAGNVFGEGFDTSPAEWNLYVDPTAAEEVVASGAPIVLVPLDATNQVPISADFLELAAVNAHTEAASLVAALLANNPLVYEGQAYFWDPLAAAAVVDPTVVTTQTARITVVTREGPDSGRTIRSADGHQVVVAVGADAPAFEALLVRTLDGLGRDAPLVTPPLPVGDAVIRFDGSSCRYDGPAAVEAGRMRFTFETSEPGWVAAVAHLTGELSVEDIAAWIDQHPGELPVPGVDRVLGVVARGVGWFDVVPSTEIVVCGSEDGRTKLVGGSFIVG